jgi:hypothetical protein
MAGHGDEILTVNTAGTAITSTNAAALLVSVGVATTTDLDLKADKASPVFSGVPQTPTPDPSDNSLTIANTAYVTTACAAVVAGGGSAPLASPAFTGVPTAPTAAPGTNTTQLATTAHVKAADDLKANLAGTVEFTGTITFSGSIDVPTQTAGNNTTKAASTAFVSTAVAAKASLASPAFTGTPTAPTAIAGTNTTQVATTAFVKAAGDLKANLASPALTGTPTAPTASAGTNTTQLSTTAFVKAAIDTIFGSASIAASGYIKFGSLFGGFMIAWGTGTTNGSATASVTYASTVLTRLGIIVMNKSTSAFNSFKVTYESGVGFDVTSSNPSTAFYYLTIGS